MADQLADMLNRVNPIQGVTTPAPPPQPAVPVNEPLRRSLLGSVFDLGRTGLEMVGNPAQFWGNVGDAIVNSPVTKNAWDYFTNTDPLTMLEAGYRANPVTGPIALAVDAATKGPQQAIQNARETAAGPAQIATDLPAAVTGTIPFLNVLSNAGLQRNDVWYGSPELAQATKWLSDRGHDVGEFVAGHPVGDSMLRGTPSEIAGNMLRNTLEAVMPVPAKVNQVVSSVRFGNSAMDTFAKYAGRVAEVVSPLAINPTPTSRAINATISNITPVVSESIYEGNPQLQGALQQPQTPAQQAADSALAVGDQGTKQAGAHAIQAGVTGNPWLDGAGAVVLAGLAWHYGMKNDFMRRMRSGIDKSLGGIPSRIGTGYNPNLEAEKTIMPPGTLIRQQYQNELESIPKATEMIMKGNPLNTAAHVDQYVDHVREDLAQRHGASVATRLQTFNRDGTFMGTGLRSTPMNDYIVNGQNVGKDIREQASQVLHAKSEMDVRQFAMRRAAAGTPIGTPTAPVGSTQADTFMLRHLATGRINEDQIAHNLSDFTYNDLRNIVQNGMANPEVAKIVNQTRGMLDTMHQYYDINKTFTQRELDVHKKTFPNFMPTAAQTNEPFLTRRFALNNWDGASGQFVTRGSRNFAELGNAMDTIPKYMERGFRLVEAEKSVRDFMQLAQHEKGRANPVADEIVGDTIRAGGNAPPFGPDVAHKVVEWRDVYGNRMQTVVHDAAVRDALNRVGNPTALQMAGGLIELGRDWRSSRFYTRMAESSMVGPLAVARGTFFPTQGLGYNVTFGLSTPNPHGVSMYRALLSIPQAGWENIRAVLADRAAAAMHNSVLTNGAIRKILGQNTQAWADQLRNWYKTTASAAMAEHGLIAPNVSSAVDPTKIYNPGTSVFNKPGPLSVVGNVMGDTGTLIGDAMHSVTNSFPTAIWKLNVDKLGKNPQQVASTIRNMAGNPGQSGAFRGQKITAKFVNDTMFGNILVQSMFKTADMLSSPKNMKRAAIGTALLVGIPAATVTAWNAQLGPEYIQHQLFGRSADQIGSSLYIGIPGKPPTEGMEITYADPITRLAAIAAQGLTAAHLGLFDGSFWRHLGTPDPYSEARAKELTERFINEMPGTYARQAFEPPVMPGIQVGTSLLGKHLENYSDLFTDRLHNQDPNKRAGFVQGRPVNPDPMSEQMFQTHMPGQMHDVFKSIMNSTGDFLFKLINGFSTDIDPTNPMRGNRTYDASDALGRTADRIGQSWADNFPGAGQLFGTFRSRTPDLGATAQYVKQKWNGILDVDQRFGATHAAGNRPELTVGTKKTGVQPYAGAHPTFADPTSEAMAQDVVLVKKEMATAEQQIGNAYRQRASIMQDNTLTPYQQRSRLEQWGYYVTDQQERLSQDLLRNEARLSQKWGVDFRFDKLKPGEPMLGLKPRIP